MANAFVIIKMCYVHNQWYDISCATLYILSCHIFETIIVTFLLILFIEDSVTKYNVPYLDFCLTMHHQLGKVIQMNQLDATMIY